MRQFRPMWTYRTSKRAYYFIGGSFSLHNTEVETKLMLVIFGLHDKVIGCLGLSGCFRVMQ
jgi:hypothetical protein